MDIKVTRSKLIIMVYDIRASVALNALTKGRSKSVQLLPKYSQHSTLKLSP